MCLKFYYLKKTQKNVSEFNLLQKYYIKIIVLFFYILIEIYYYYYYYYCRLKHIVIVPK